MFLQITEPDESYTPDNSPALGIDLGTTNSVVSILTDENPRIICIEPNGLVPSVVNYQGKDIVVGSDALPGGIKSIKRLLGQGLTPESLPYSPIEISGHILSHLKTQAEILEGISFNQAVITVPAHFDDGARNATLKAAHKAGLNVLRLINEPTAAALAYGLDHGTEGVYAIYDLGGGTFDISILKFTQGVFQVLSTHGHIHLGGDDIDLAIAKSQNIDISNARILKETDPHRFDSLISPFIEQTMESVTLALKDAKVSVDQIQGVILVGGSTRLPQVRKAVESFFGRKPLCDHNPDFTVAIGAAYQAKALTQGSDTLLLDVCPLSLSLEILGEQVERIIHRNTPIPISKTQTFTTSHNGQSSLSLHVLQGEKESVQGNRSLARFILGGIPPMEAGQPRIEVRFTLDVDGLLTVQAKEQTTGISQKIEIKPSYGLDLSHIKELLA
jgi:molecular chaperone HscA